MGMTGIEPMFAMKSLAANEFAEGVLIIPDQHAGNQIVIAQFHRVEESGCNQVGRSSSSVRCAGFRK
jgi:hypothetical protein